MGSGVWITVQTQLVKDLESDAMAKNRLLGWGHMNQLLYTTYFTTLELLKELSVTAMRWTLNNLLLAVLRILLYKGFCID